MRKLRNVLYITHPKSYLSQDGESVVVSVENKELARIPIHNLEGIVSFGFMGASPGLMALCSERDVGMSFVSPYGKFLARVGGGVSGNVLLRKKQYYLSDDETGSAEVARWIVLGKLANCRSVLHRFSRDHGEMVSPEFMTNLARIDEGMESIKNNRMTLNELRGMEGVLSKYYFAAFDDLILSTDHRFSFESRSRRPPLNRVNALLSFVYMLIAADCRFGSS